MTPLGELERAVAWRPPSAFASHGAWGMWAKATSVGTPATAREANQPDFDTQLFLFDWTVCAFRPEEGSMESPSMQPPQSSQNETADTVLLLASNGHPMPALQVLMSLEKDETQAALQISDAGGTSLLHWFALQSCLPAVKYLLELGMNVSADQVECSQLNQ